MRFIILLLFIIYTNSCENKGKIDKITISGTIVDNNELPIENVKITLEETCFMCMGALPINSMYSDSIGSFSITFSPRENQVYHLELEKKEFSKTSINIELNRNNQEFKVKMSNLNRN